MTFYNYETNAILVRLMETKKNTELNNNIIHIINKLTQRGFKPKFWILDKKCSQEMKKAIIDLYIIFQLVPIGIHQYNVGERQIQTFKAHFITNLVSVNPKFSIHLWDKLV